MLDTLYRFGQYLSQDSTRGEFDDIISPPPIDENEKKKDYQFLIAEVIFNLDAGIFQLNPQPKTYDELDKSAKWTAYSLRCIKIQGGNNKSIYLSVDPRKSFEPWKKTLFGKEDKSGTPPKAPELLEAIQKDYPDLSDSTVCKAVTRIFKMRTDFAVEFPEWKKVVEALNWSEKSRAVLLFASIVSEELGCITPTPLAHLEGYDEFLRRKFLQTDIGAANSNDPASLLSPKLCYVTGRLQANVEEPYFSSRYSLNKMFVTTTKNYASGFDDKIFSKNYQISKESQTFLERGSKYILDNLTVKIAGVDHCILPQFYSSQSIDLSDQTTRIKNKSELLFLMREHEEFSTLIWEFNEISDGQLYWITFLGYESDGNFFKTINQIKDVSKTHFEQIIKVLLEVNNEMLQAAEQQWIETMTYGKEKKSFSFNFNTIYNLIPVRKDKEKRNAALALFKAVLERRPIEKPALFKYFSELIQCHKFGRYSGNNVLPNNVFDFAIRDAVFQYHALLLFLKKIKLLNMEDQSKPSSASLEESNSAISAFFSRMSYTDDQKAAFYLGRILSSIGQAQYKKGHKTKPVLQKVNYNGMDAAALKRLYSDLFEKSKQYEVLKYNEANFSKFTDLFVDSKDNPWNKRIKSEESLFYLLAGYSYRTPKEAASDEDIESSSSLTSI